MKKIVYHLFVVVFLLFASCENRVEEELLIPEVPVPILFATNQLDVSTKAAVEGTVLPDGSPLSLFAIQHMGIPRWEDENYLLNNRLATVATSTINYEGTPAYYPNSNYLTDFYAVYPTGTDLGVSVNTSLGTAPTFTIDISKQADVMIASVLNQVKSTTPVSLNFQHLLVQIRFQVSALAAGSVLTKVEIETVGNMIVNLDKTIHSQGDAVRITVAEGVSVPLSATPQNLQNDGKEISALIVPYTDLSQLLFYFTTADRRTYTVKPTAPSSLQSGCVYTFSIVLPS